jgi:hypothetical protein
MMKKYSWIAALVLALSLAFFACDNGGGGGGGGKTPPPPGNDYDENVNPVASDANFIRISSRENNYDTIDLRAGKANALGNWTASKGHTITVYGRGATAAGTAAKSVAGKIRFAMTDSPWTAYSPNFDTDGSGLFTMTRDFTWAEISNADQNIRLQAEPDFKIIYFYEIVIEDEDGTEVYKLSEDADIQGLDSGDKPFPNGDQSPTTWLAQAGGPRIEAMVPGEEAPPPPPPPPPPSEDAFNDAVGLTGLTNEWGTSRSIVADATTGIISRVTGSDGSALFSVDIPGSQAVTASATIKVTYIAVVEEETPVAGVKLTAKLPGTSNDLSSATYIDLTGDGTEHTFEIPASIYGATVATLAKLSFQDNSAATSVWKLKIISIEIVAGAADLPITTTAIPLAKPVAGVAATFAVTTAQYTGVVVWNPAVADGADFATSTEYTATITLTAIAGYTFGDADEDFFTHADATSIEFDPDTKVVTVVFPATGAAGLAEAVLDPVPAPTKMGSDGNATVTITGNVVAVEATATGGGVGFYYTFDESYKAYTTLRITYTAALTGAVAKVSVKNGANSWSGIATGQYKDIVDGGTTFDVTIAELTGTTFGISFQINNNGDSDIPQDWTFEVTEFKFIP